ncbi:serine hydrolase domain-containing protein [Actinophytocola oryzae]|uniref:CubicO group peptidase (Beta-lactamase class C family) n=1 Tax=Actinophytocola oryzae TaxID=502181 RepID=A0A4R7VXM1_9PSEU|nr:serine hydrolase domain-containing protein [Actinophytocola oryzae]TDV54883.1 CubicO group peptidase (beta-lactamase class C family) [Actinophytocola oryzae]
MLSSVPELLAEYGVPGATIGILHDGEITEKSFGVRDVTTGAPTTADTVYQVGSMTKTWTALAFMRLVAEGKADLDTPVRTYLPDFRVADPSVTSAVTPRQLLNHTNGIEEDFGDPGEDDDVLARMVANIADAPQVFPLGHTHGYSAALGYAILARVMEVVEGRQWDDIVRDRLLRPLGQNDTDTRHADDPRAATGHILRSLDEGPIVTPIDHLPRAFGPGGNMTSTVRDVLTMARVFLDGDLLPAGVLAEMTRSRVPVPDPYLFGPEWALGLIVCDWHGETVYASDGSTIGQNSRLRILPEHDLAITMLTNGGPREPFYRTVFNEILAKLGAPTIPELPEPDPTLRLDPARYTGVYARPGTHYEVTAPDGNLCLTSTLDPMHASFTGRPERITYDLFPISDTHFLMPPGSPLEDPQTVAIYDFADGAARYLHTNCRVTPRV